MCKYEWEYKGKKYHETIEYISTSHNRPPQSVELYFRKSPKYAKTYER